MFTPKERLARILAEAGAPLVVGGHTHRQFDRTAGGRRMVNAGSVGRPTSTSRARTGSGSGPRRRAPPHELRHRRGRGAVPRARLSVRRRDARPRRRRRRGRRVRGVEREAGVAGVADRARSRREVRHLRRAPRAAGRRARRRAGARRGLRRRHGRVHRRGRAARRHHRGARRAAARAAPAPVAARLPRLRGPPEERLRAPRPRHPGRVVRRPRLLQGHARHGDRPGGGDPVAGLDRQARPRARARRGDRCGRARPRQDDAPAAIFGYTIWNDVSARDVQGRELPVGMGPGKAKDWDGSNVLGPCIATARRGRPRRGAHAGARQRRAVGRGHAREHAPLLRRT